MASLSRNWGSASSKSLPKKPRRQWKTRSKPGTATSTLRPPTGMKPASERPSPRPGSPAKSFSSPPKLRNGEQGEAYDAFQRSREALGLDVIDLYLIHWPVPSQGLYTQAWKEMEKLYQDKQIRAIGVSNFLPEHLDTLLRETEVVPAVNQIELHPTFQQADLANKCRWTRASPSRLTARWDRART